MIDTMRELFADELETVSGGDCNGGAAGCAGLGVFAAAAFASIVQGAAQNYAGFVALDTPGGCYGGNGNYAWMCA